MKFSFEIFSIALGIAAFFGVYFIFKKGKTKQNENLEIEASGSEKKQMAAFLNFLGAFGALNSEKSDKAVLTEIISSVQSLLQAETVAIFLSERGKEHLKLFYLNSLESEEGGINWNTSVIRQTFDQQVLIFEPDVLENFTSTTSIKALSARSFLTCPISTS